MERAGLGVCVLAPSQPGPSGGKNREKREWRGWRRYLWRLWGLFQVRLQGLSLPVRPCCQGESAGWTLDGRWMDAGKGVAWEGCNTNGPCFFGSLHLPPPLGSKANAKDGVPSLQDTYTLTRLQHSGCRFQGTTVRSLSPLHLQAVRMNCPPIQLRRTAHYNPLLIHYRPVQQLALAPPPPSPLPSPEPQAGAVGVALALASSLGACA